MFVEFRDCADRFHGARLDPSAPSANDQRYKIDMKKDEIPQGNDFLTLWLLRYDTDIRTPVDFVALRPSIPHADPFRRAAN
jgi:hypothetical protein